MVAQTMGKATEISFKSSYSQVTMIFTIKSNLLFRGLRNKQTKFKWKINIQLDFPLDLQE